MELKAIIILFTIVTFMAAIDCYTPSGGGPPKEKIWKRPIGGEPIPDSSMVCPAHTVPTYTGWIDGIEALCCSTTRENPRDMSACFNSCPPVSSLYTVSVWSTWTWYRNYTQCPCESSGSLKPFCPAGMGLRRTPDGLIHCCPPWIEGTDKCVRLCEPMSQKAEAQYYKDGGTLAWEETCVCDRVTVHSRSQPPSPPESSSSTTIVPAIHYLPLLIVAMILLQ